MNPRLRQLAFCTFAQTQLWPDLREHLLRLPDVTVTEDPIDLLGQSWIDFRFHGHSFIVTADAGEFLFFLDGNRCPESVLLEIVNHCQRFFDDRGNVAQRRV